MVFFKLVLCPQFTKRDQTVLKKYLITYLKKEMNPYSLDTRCSKCSELEKEIKRLNEVLLLQQENTKLKEGTKTEKGTETFSHG